MAGQTPVTGSRSPTGLQFSTGPLAVSAVLVGVGGILAIAGFALGGVTLMSAARRRVQEMEQPPAELLRQHWEKTKAATAAGASAWHDGAPVH
jgi:hypothetical protein